ncbi:unnamed protein product [Notodromas monacha]|uniref:Cell division cycle protein 27 homolog n=1 Tax=Notodromas monacha TaxID=399045 RepID=A0A7R9BSV5_9CRUS|nr:unnamed protein product [Notodromas monacha]CAG0919731.1 unnamed protein product [Notodromas monacha]
MIVLEPVQAAVWNCLQNFMYSDAVFLAERLHAELTTEESAHTLATCYYKAGDTLQAYDVLSKCPVSKPASKYLLARCCWKINRLQEAEAALVGSQGLKGFDELVAEFGDMSCFVLAMLGELYVKSERRNLGVQALRKALSLNPFLFSTFQLLCNLGESPNPKEFFRFDSTDSTHNLGTSCWQNFAHSKLTLNQSIAVHPHHQVTHVFPEDHSTPAHPVS